MAYSSESILRFRGRALTVTILLVAAHVLSMLVGLLVPSWNDWLAYSSGDVLGRFAIWQLFTHAFVHQPSLWFAVGMLFFFWFGTEVEKYLGPKTYLLVYTILVFTPSLSATVLSLAHPVVLAGAALPTLGVFVLFAYLYPTVELLLRIQARWLAVGLSALYAVQDIGNRDWISLGLLVVLQITLFEVARRLGIRSAVGLAERLGPTEARSEPAPFRRRGVRAGSRRQRPARADAKATPPRPRNDIPEAERANPDVDAILDKISRSGIASLTVEERDHLESARRRLLEKEVGG